MNTLSFCTEMFWIDVMVRLKKDCGWEPLAIVSGMDIRERVTELFPKALFLDAFDIIRGVYPDSGNGREKPLGETILQKMAPYESLVLKMMDRMDPLRCFSYPERVRLYHRNLKFWRSFFETRKVDMVFFPVIPHMVYDYVAYLVARDRGIPTLTFNRPAFRGQVVLQDDIDKLPPGLKDTYDRFLASGEKPNLSKRMNTYLESLRKPAEVSAQVHWRHRGVSYTGKSHGIRATLNRLAGHASNLINKFKGTDKPRQGKLYNKVPGRLIEEVDPQDAIHTKVRKQGKANLAKLREYYESICSPPPEAPYVFAALSYQPEQNTSPQAGQFVHQYLMVELLAHSLPKGWELYVKEHPATLHLEKKKGECARDGWFYRDITALPRTSLASLNTNTIALADSARAVGTATGTVGWEALVRGKPVLLFGHCWYGLCEGVFHIRDADQCVKALNEIKAGYTLDTNKTDMYMSAWEAFGIRGYNYGSHANSADVDPETNVTNLAAALRDYFNR